MLAIANESVTSGHRPIVEIYNVENVSSFVFAVSQSGFQHYDAARNLMRHKGVYLYPCTSLLSVSMHANAIDSLIVRSSEQRGSTVWPIPLVVLIAAPIQHDISPRAEVQRYRMKLLRDVYTHSGAYCDCSSTFAFLAKN